ncbi:hypothetical protein GW793_00860 [bacterium]|uniref:Uncharacterized protein n=2 Tax=Katanobacteria TaxID=422282 RepID=A0A2M7X4J7_UNCKA|nr:hypothetical protein [bacterium]PIP56835.1 MAG: hypothetical protein COX05_00865 [candidate division WWE3 bacterium CG22_combo_CG10-13_8_21_14_all_39_12]PJA41093.1 MAG: hypothetical protein CO179_00690 [candidate division WWE3 bacterium CG_4_9_14_3_um_filter_39_7]
MGLLLSKLYTLRRELENVIISGLGLFSFYVLIMRFASGSWRYTLDQFIQLWPWMALLIVGFSVQVGLYTRLRAVQKSSNNTVTKASAATSGFAMVACCAHHIVDVLPTIGLSAASLFLAQYQTEIFVLAVAFNFGGVVFVYRQLKQVQRLNHPYTIE